MRQWKERSEGRYVDRKRDVRGENVEGGREMVKGDRRETWRKSEG